jgi:hypothetical protein
MEALHDHRSGDNNNVTDSRGDPVQQPHHKTTKEAAAVSTRASHKAAMTATKSRKVPGTKSVVIKHNVHPRAGTTCDKENPHRPYHAPQSTYIHPKGYD